MNKTQPRKKTLIGVVASNKMNKTIVVKIVRRVKHALYHKIIKRTTKIHVHDEKNECNVGDVVKITESCPVSKTKSWFLMEILEKVL